MLQSIRDGDRLIVRIDGELDHFCAQSVRRDLEALLLDRSIRTLILDFSSLTFMDSSGIGVVLGRYRLLRDRGGVFGQGKESDFHFVVMAHACAS